MLDGTVGVDELVVADGLLEAAESELRQVLAYFLRQELEEVAEQRVWGVFIGCSGQAQPDGAGNGNQEAGEAHATDAFAQEDEGADGDEQR